MAMGVILLMLWLTANVFIGSLARKARGVTREQAEHFIEQARTDARQNRLNLPKGRKVPLNFKEAATEYLVKLEQEGVKIFPPSAKN